MCILCDVGVRLASSSQSQSCYRTVSDIQYTYTYSIHAHMLYLHTHYTTYRTHLLYTSTLIIYYTIHLIYYTPTSTYYVHSLYTPYSYIHIHSVRQGRTKEAVTIVRALCTSGYAATDVIQTLFKVSIATLIGVYTRIHTVFMQCLSKDILYSSGRLYI